MTAARISRVCLLWLAIALGTTPGAAATNSSTPDRTFVTNDLVTSLARIGDTVYLGGRFTAIGPRAAAIAKLSQAGATADLTLPEITGGSLAEAQVRAVVSDGGGGWFIGGDFNYVGGVPRMHLAHIRADGTLDPDFSPRLQRFDGLHAPVFALARSGSRLFVGGRFQIDEHGGRVQNLAVLDTDDGRLLVSEQLVEGGFVDALALRGSTLYVGGSLFEVADAPRLSAGAIDTDTWEATPFDPQPNGSPVRAIAATDSAVYVGGSFTEIGGAEREGLAALDPVTGDATAFRADANFDVNALLASGSTLYAGGGFTEVGGEPRGGLAAVDAATGAVKALRADVPPVSTVDALALDGTNLYVGGNFGVLGGTPRGALAAVDAQSGALRAWNPRADGPVMALGHQGGSVLAGGGFRAINLVDRRHLAAVRASDGRPTAWAPEADGFVNALAASGTLVYAAGDFTNVGGEARRHLAALDGTTGDATGWDPHPSDPVTAIAVSEDGATVFVGGDFLGFGPGLETSRPSVAAIRSSDGELTAFDAHAPENELIFPRVVGMAVSGSTVYVSGLFDWSIGGQPRRNLAALDAQTGNATAWNPSPDDTVREVLPAGGSVYVAGAFNSIAGAERKGLAELSAATGAPTAWNPAPNEAQVNDLALAGSTIYAGGLFHALGAEERFLLAEIRRSDGGVTTFSPQLYGTTSTPFATVTDLLAGPDGRLHAGGSFDTAAAGRLPGGGIDQTEALLQPNYASFSDHGAPANEVEPAVRGEPAVGRALTCERGAWSGNTPLSIGYEWLLDGSLIGGANQADYVVKVADSGRHLACRVTAANEQGAASAVSAAVALPDVAPPETTIDSAPPPPPGASDDLTPTFEFSSSEPGSTFECSVDGVPYQPCSSPYTAGPLAEGLHTFVVRATDLAGNTDQSPAGLNFRLDATLLETTILDGPSGSTTDTTPSFAFAASEPGAGFQCRIDAGPFLLCTSPFTSQVLAGGDHVFEVRAYDGSGYVDSTPAQRAFTVVVPLVVPPGGDPSGPSSGLPPGPGRAALLAALGTDLQAAARRIGRLDARRLARAGGTVLPSLDALAPGRFSAILSGAGGGAARPLRLARGTSSAPAAGTYRLTLRLTTAGRRHLRRARRTRARLRLTFSPSQGQAVTRQAAVRLIRHRGAG